jgi:phosphotransferase system enzyme I (PtsP)
MVTEVREFREAKTVVRKEAERLARSGSPVPSKLEVGAMIEVPSLLFELDLLLPECDFASIGSNDLIQFLTATDRANPRVASNYDPIDRPRLRAIRHIVRACTDHNVPVTMCGELAGRSIDALALLSIGLTRLSMGASSIGPVKDMVLGLELKPIQQAVAAALDDVDNDRPIRELLTELAQGQKLPI